MTASAPQSSVGLPAAADIAVSSLVGVYGTAEQLGLIVLFNAVMFVLAEVPLVGYLVQPEATTER